jgi:hypothetical protein
MFASDKQKFAVHTKSTHYMRKVSGHVHQKNEKTDQEHLIGLQKNEQHIFMAPLSVAPRRQQQ